MNNQSRFVLFAGVLCSVSGIAQAQNSQPLSGAYQCKMEFMHMMPGTNGTAMINAASCKFDGDDANTTTFTNNVQFNEKGVGKLINSNGVTLQAGKPITAYIGDQATWVLKMQDGKMVGYTAKGINRIVAGENVGKNIHWTAVPTGTDTATISFEVK